MRKAVLVLGMLVVAIACYPVLAQTQDPGSTPGRSGQTGQPGAMTPGAPGNEKPLVTPTELRALEAAGITSVSKAISDAESHTKGKAVAVIPVQNPQGEASFQIYTLKDGQLSSTAMDAKNGKVLSSRSANEITEVARTRFAGHEEMGGQQPGGMRPPQETPGTSSNEKPLVSLTDLKALEERGMASLSKAVSDAESRANGKAVAVIPIRNPQNEFSFQVYTLKDGQLAQSTIDAKNGKVLSSHPVNEIVELSRTRYAGHEEMGGQQPEGTKPPQPDRPQPNRP